MAATTRSKGKQEQMSMANHVRKYSFARMILYIWGGVDQEGHVRGEIISA